MAFQSVPETVEITVNYTYGGNQIVNTYHARQSGGYNQAGIDALAVAIDNTAVPGLLADQTVWIDYMRTDVRGLENENDITASASASAASGGLGVVGTPGNVSFAVQRLSGLTGRSARGRVYVAGIPASYVDGSKAAVGKLESAAAAAYVGHIDGFRTVIDAVGTWDPVIVSRYNEGSKRATGVTFPWTSTQYSSLRLATMRKRLD